MAIKWQGQHVISPFSRIKDFAYPPTEGFMFYPVEDQNPNGWGKPFAKKKPQAEWADPTIPEYDDLPYGTSGGPDPIKHLYRVLDKKTQQSKWTWAKAPGDQLYGNIDWIGPYLPDKKGTRDGTTEKRHERISYNGPPMRYFAAHPDDFAYGTDAIHEEIYYQGRYLAIAPDPVLGACIRIDKVPDLDAKGNKQYDPITGKLLEVEEKWILAICKEGLEDALYKRPYPAKTLLKSDMNETTRASFKVFKSDQEPNGWELLFKLSQLSGAYIPETPWFFNESGTEAAASRRFEDSFNNGQNAVKEDGFYLLKGYISDMSSASLIQDFAAHTSGTWGDKVKFKNITIKDHPAEYTDDGLIALDGFLYTHVWQEDTIVINTTLSGDLIVCRDYVGDKIIEGHLIISKFRTQQQKFVLGKDALDYQDSQGHSISNALGSGNPNVRKGPVYQYPAGYIPLMVDHLANAWIGEDGDMVLKWSHPTEGDMRFTLEQWILGTESEYNTDWEIRSEGGSWHVTLMFERFIHYLDIRKKLVLYLEHAHEFFLYKGGFQANTIVGPTRKLFRREIIEMAPTDTSNPDKSEDNFYILREIQEEEISPHWEYVIFSIGFPYRYMENEWQTSGETIQTYTTDSWEAAWSAENTGQAIRQEDPATGTTTAATACPLIIPRDDDFWWTGGNYPRHLDSSEWGENEPTGTYWASYFRSDLSGTWWSYTGVDHSHWLTIPMLTKTSRHNHRVFGIGTYTHIAVDGVETDWTFLSIMTKLRDKQDEPKNLLVEGLDLQNANGVLEKVLTFGTKYYPIGIY